MTKTNPYQVIIDLKLEADYLSQESCVTLMKEFAKRELESQGKEKVFPFVDVVIREERSELFCGVKKGFCPFEAKDRKCTLDYTCVNQVAK